MNKTRNMVQSILQLIFFRLNDATSMDRRSSKESMLTLVYNTNTKQNERVRQIMRLLISVNESAKDENDQVISDIGRYLYGETLNILRRISRQFLLEKIGKPNYTGLIILFREYFKRINDIRMVSRLEELFRSKSIKKPVILNKILKILVQLTREFILEKLKAANQTISENETNYYRSERPTLKREQDYHAFQSYPKKYLLKVVCPAFMMDPLPTKVQQENFTKRENIKLGSLAILRNKLKERWKRKTNKQNQQNKRMSRSSFLAEAPRRTFGSFPLNSTNFFFKKSIDSLEMQVQKDTTLIYSNQPGASDTVARDTRLNVRKIHDNVPLQSPLSRILQQKSKNIFNFNTFQSCYGILELQQKIVSKAFFKKSQKSYQQVELKNSIARNKDILRQRLTFRKKL